MRYTSHRPGRLLPLTAIAALAVAAGLLTYGGSPVGPTTAEATTFVVTRTDDPPPDGCDSGVDCSLREAIIAANADTSEPHVIQLQSGATYTLSIPNNGGSAEEEGDLDIAEDVDLTIEALDGGRATIEQTAPESRVLSIDEDSTSLTLAGIVVTGGDPTTNGGGILSFGSLLFIQSSVVGNTATSGSGGGIYSEGTVTLIGSTVSGNTATEGFGGGGIHNGGGSLTLTNSTVSGNSADVAGGGIFNIEGTATLTNSTVAFNSAPAGAGIFDVASNTVNLSNTIVALNIDGPDCETDGGSFVSQGNNLDSDGSCGLDPLLNDIPNGNANLGSLQDNGGPTLTHALLSGSDAIDAIDAGNDAVCSAAPVNGVDQRGEPRPVDGDQDGSAVCDIGAFELQLDATDLSVTKVCVGESFEAAFEITVEGAVTEAIACGETLEVAGMAPGEYTLSEAIGGPDADGFTTAIACSDGLQAEGTSAQVTVPESGSLFCVVINAFGADLLPLLCPCLDLEVDIDNANTNATGVDNANENSNRNSNANASDNANGNTNQNDNANENAQHQDNAQEQDNANEQTNNVTSSPEVNIDFEE